MRVLVFGLGRSGTSYLAYRLAKAIGTNYVFFEPPRRDRDAERGKPNVVTKLIFNISDPSTRFTQVQDDYADYDKKIWICRDPRDQTLSRFFYRWYHDPRLGSWTFWRAVRMVAGKERSPGSIPFYRIMVRSLYGHRQALIESIKELYGEPLYAFVEEIKNSDWYIFRYEDMIDNRFAGVDRYLGVSTDVRTELPERYRHVIRSKTYDNWRHWFTQADVEFFKPLLSRYMEAMGYDTGDWNLVECDVLPAAQGSQYMKQLYYWGSEPRVFPTTMQLKSLLRFPRKGQ